MRTHLGALVVAGWTAVLGVGFAGCTYDPQPLDGKLRCSSSGECPEGYSCTTCGTCWSDSGGGDNSGGLWGSAIPVTTLSQYAGSWAFGSCANLETRCDDGFKESSAINADPADPSIMYITAGPPGEADLVSDWLCILNLRLTSGGAHLYGDGQGCTITNPDVAGLEQTWTANRFDVVTTDGVNAIHSAVYTRYDEYSSSGETVTCTQRVHAPMTKM